MNDLERWNNFLSKIEKTDSCWNWTGKLNHGYGEVWNGKRNIRAHRYMWEKKNGPISGNKTLVCHHCDNRKCVRLSHLFLGSHHDNWADARKKGRTFNPPLNRGEKCHNALLKPQQAIEIFISDERPQTLANRYKVSHAVPYYIKLGKSWKHLTNNPLVEDAKRIFPFLRDKLLHDLSTAVQQGIFPSEAFKDELP